MFLFLVGGVGILNSRSAGSRRATISTMIAKSSLQRQTWWLSMPNRPNAEKHPQGYVNAEGSPETGPKSSIAYHSDIQLTKA